MGTELSRSHERVGLATFGSAAIVAVGAIGTVLFWGQPTAALLFGVITAIGAFLVVWSIVAANKLGTRTRINEAGDNAARDAEIASAVARAIEAHKKAEAAGTGAAEASRLAEEERLARLKSLAPRALTSDQLVEMSSALSVFAGMRAAVVTVIGHEPKTLATSLRAAMKAAGWTVGLLENNSGASGIWIEVSQDATGETGRAAGALLAALVSAGLSARPPVRFGTVPRGAMWSGLADDVVDSPSVTLTIGSK